MKTAPCLAVFAMLTGVLRAGWSELQPGMDAPAAFQCVGAPILQSKGKATQQWNYDRGGFILFERGRVISWEQPKADPAAAKPVARTAPAPKLPLPKRANVLAQN